MYERGLLSVRPARMVVGAMNGPPTEFASLCLVSYVVPSAPLTTNQSLSYPSWTLTGCWEIFRTLNMTRRTSPTWTGVVTVAVQRTRPPRIRRLELVEFAETAVPCGGCDVGLLPW
jgi:hypothetical protein